MSGSGDLRGALQASALVALLIAGFLLLGTWDGLYDALELPQPIPALTGQLGGAAFAGLAYLLWSASARPELAQTAAAAGAIAHGASALVIALWLIFRDPETDLGIDTLGTVILIVLAVVLAALAVALARPALTQRQRP